MSATPATAEDKLEDLDLRQLALRFEMDPNNVQRTKFNWCVGHSRFSYNWALAESQRVYQETGKRPSVKKLRSQLAELKKTDYPWLNDVSAHIPQQAITDLQRSFDRFFKGLKGEGPKSGFPKFKKKFRSRDSARMYEFKLEGRYVQLPKIGKVRLKEKPRRLRQLERQGGRVLSATITREADRWFISFQVAVPVESLPAPQRSKSADASVAGVDLGLLHSAVVYDGESCTYYEGPRALRASLAILKRLDRQLSRKTRKSGKYRKLQARRQRLHLRVKNQRNDFIDKLTSDLAQSHGVIVIEDLSVKGMMSGRLALSTADQGFGHLRQRLSYKTDWQGSTLIVADRFYPSSQLCSDCGVRNEGMKGLPGLKKRVFDCPSCGLSLDRDENAARNIRQWGLDALASASLAELAEFAELFEPVTLEPRQERLPAGRREVTPVTDCLDGVKGDAGYTADVAGEEGSGSSREDGVKPTSVKREAGGSGDRVRSPAGSTGKPAESEATRR